MRIGINISKELHKRLEPLKPELNISQVCREALEAKAANHERMRANLDDPAVQQAMGRVWEQEKEFRAVIEMDWEQLGYEDAVAWVQAASWEDWRYVHDIQDVRKRQGSPAWSFSAPPPREIQNFDSRVDEIRERINQQSDDFFDWLYEEHGGPSIDYKAAQREYMTAWLSYVNKAWELFLKMEREYAEERSQQRQEARRNRIQPQVSEQLLNRLPAEYRKIITIELSKRNGQPCIRGTRITVYDVMEYLAGGMTESEVLANFPELTREDILACYAFAAEPKRRILHSYPENHTHLLPEPESQPDKPPFRVIPHHGKFAPGVAEMNLNHLNAQLEEEELLAKLARSGPMEPETEAQPENPPFRVIPNHSKLAPGVENMNLNHLAAELDDELFLEKMERDRAREREQEQPQ